MTATGDVVDTIKAHHAELLAAVTGRVNAVVGAARDGAPHAQAVHDLVDLLRREVVPHARAEEDVLYAAATDATLRPLVTGMVFEHETLLGLAADLAAAPTAVDAAVTARGFLEVFAGHVRRENDLLLPALAVDAGVDLPGVLGRMGEVFTSYQKDAVG